jgi:DNA-binding NarL/FixJ family response regulator
MRLRSSPEPDVILFDLGLPDVGGVEAMRELRQHAENSAVVIVSGTDDTQLVHACIEAGAMGFVHKASDSRTMLDALREVMAGRVVLPPTMESRLDAVSAIVPELTPRQREVLARLVKGKTNKIIGRELGINEATVKSHVTGVLQALGASNRTEAVYAVRKLGIRFS